MMNIALWIVTGVLVLFSFFKSKEKTILALQVAFRKFREILPLFLMIMAFFALIVTFVPSEFIQKYIGIDSGLAGIVTALGLGSISIMPGFAAFPMCAALKTEGIPYYIIAAFSLSLMNVGIITFPIERKYLGAKVAILRNILALLVCIVAVIIVKLFFGE